MKYVIKENKEYNEEGVTKYAVTIQTPIGCFTGVAKLHPEDEPYKKRFFGYEIAERKAYIKALKKRAKQLEKVDKPSALNTKLEIELSIINMIAIIRSADNYNHGQNSKNEK